MANRNLVCGSVWIFTTMLTTAGVLMLALLKLANCKLEEHCSYLSPIDGDGGYLVRANEIVLNDSSPLANLTCSTASSLDEGCNFSVLAAVMLGVSAIGASLAACIFMMKFINDKFYNPENSALLPAANSNLEENRRSWPELFHPRRATPPMELKEVERTPSDNNSSAYQQAPNSV